MANEILQSAVTELDSRWQAEARQWPLVRRNRAIVSRNRAMREICDMLGMEFTEMPLEVPNENQA